MIDQSMIIIAVCCREWPILIGARIGPCGLCGETPKVRRPTQ